MISLSNYCRKERVSFVVYADLEYTLERMKKEDMETLVTSYTYNRFLYSIAYYVHCLYDDSLSKYRFRRNNDCIAWFAEELKNLVYNVKTILSANVSMADFTKNNWIKFNSATHCYVCVRSRSQKMTHGYAIIVISPGDIEAPRIQIAT